MEKEKNIKQPESIVDRMKKAKEKKDQQKKSLGVSGTTKEKAAEAGYISSLVDEALGLAAAEKEPEYK